MTLATLFRKKKKWNWPQKCSRGDSVLNGYYFTGWYPSIKFIWDHSTSERIIKIGDQWAKISHTKKTTRPSTHEPTFIGSKVNTTFNCTKIYTEVIKGNLLWPPFWKSRLFMSKYWDTNIYIQTVIYHFDLWWSVYQYLYYKTVIDTLTDRLT